MDTPRERKLVICLTLDCFAFLQRTVWMCTCILLYEHWTSSSLWTFDDGVHSRMKVCFWTTHFGRPFDSLQCYLFSSIFFFLSFYYHHRAMLAWVGASWLVSGNPVEKSVNEGKSVKKQLVKALWNIFYWQHGCSLSLFKTIYKQKIKRLRLCQLRSLALYTELLLLPMMMISMTKIFLCFSLSLSIYLTSLYLLKFSFKFFFSPDVFLFCVASLIADCCCSIGKSQQNVWISCIHS